MTETPRKIHEMRKPSGKDFGFLDIQDAGQLSVLRYFFVHEEQQAKKIEDTFGRIESLLRLSLSAHEQASAAFLEVLTKWKTASGLKTMENVRELNKQYEEIIVKHVEKPSEVAELTRITGEELEYILTLVHDRNIEDVESLNEYKPWTAEVYGETTFGYTKTMLEELNVGRDETFLDLGSGVGRVVMQAAALFNCKKAVGIELMENRAKFAKDMDVEFKALMAWLGKEHGEYELIHGDFRQYPEVIAQSSVIFCNNFAFDEELNFELKSIFADKLPEKVRILVSKSLRDEKFRITEKTASDGAAVLPVRRTFQGKMSWTDNPVVFYLHEVDSTTLARFTESRKDPVKRAAYEEEQRQLRPKYYESSSEQSQDVDPADLTEEENQNPSGKRSGCTTRSQWKTSVKRRRVTNDNVQSDEEDSDNSNSDASTQRTRSIPSHDSNSRVTSKRKRGRPAKSAARSAPSSTSDSALQTLYTHTVKSFSGIDRTVQPGCVSNTIELTPSDDLPVEYQNCLKHIEAAMRKHWRSVQESAYPSHVENQLNLDKMKLVQLKDTHGRLQNEVRALRLFCKKLLEAMFDARHLRLPRTADDLSRDSRDMLQTTTLLRERNNTLKDDIHWLENAHNAHTFAKSQFEQGFSALNGKHLGKAPAASYQVNGNFSGVSPGPGSEMGPPVRQNHAPFPSSMHGSQSFTPGPGINGSPSAITSRPISHPSSNPPREFAKPRGGETAPDAMDLSRMPTVPKREGPISRGLHSYGQTLDASQSSNVPSKAPASRQPTSQGPSGHGKQHQSPGPSGPTFMSELGRVIESSLLGPPTSSNREAPSSFKNEGNLRGLSPIVHSRHQQQQQQERAPSREKAALSRTDSPARQHQTPRTTAQATTPFAVPTQELMGRQYPAAVVHGQVVYPGIVGTGQPASQPFQASHMPGVYGEYAFNPGHGGATGQNYASPQDPRQTHPGWPHQYSAVHFDPSQITASLTGGAFCGLPGGVAAANGAPRDGRLSGQPRAVGFEAISPPPR